MPVSGVQEGAQEDWILRSWGGGLSGYRYRKNGRRVQSVAITSRKDATVISECGEGHVGGRERVSRARERIGTWPPEVAPHQRALSPSLSLLHTTGLHDTTLDMACSHPHTATEPQLLQAILAELQNLKASQAHLENKVRPTRAYPRTATEQN